MATHQIGLQTVAYLEIKSWRQRAKNHHTFIITFIKMRSSILNFVDKIYYQRKKVVFSNLIIFYDYVLTID